LTRGRFDTLLAWYFVAVWGSGFIASKIGLQHAAPFTFLVLRFTFGLLCLAAVVAVVRPRWPAGRSQWFHVAVAGLLMHAVHLGGSHYTQHLGMSAGITAVLLSVQPLLTALAAARWLDEPLLPRQWLGIMIGLGGVMLVVWHKIDMHEATAASLLAVTVSLLGVTAGVLYQRTFCPVVDLRSASLIQFAAALLVFAPLAYLFEDNTVIWGWPLAGSIFFLVIAASILAVNALHVLMRRGQAARVTGLIYLTPVFAVALELALFREVPSVLSMAGMLVACAGVGLLGWNPAAPGGKGRDPASRI